MSDHQPPPEGVPPRRPLPPLGVSRAGGVLWARVALVAFSALIGVLLIARGNAALGAALVAVAAIRLFIVVRTRQRLNAIRAARADRLAPRRPFD